jgi:RecB family exonuclease
MSDLLPTASDQFRLSVSKSKSFNLCRKQYQFNYLLKFPKKDFPFHTTGSFCHLVLETFHQYYVDGCDLPHNAAMGNAWKVAWVKYKDKMTPEMKKECWELINQYLRLIADGKVNFNILACEKPFSFLIDDNVILNGAIDLISLDKDNVVCVGDYKTTRNIRYLKNDWFQLLVYALVLHTSDPTITKVRASYIPIRHNYEKITKEFNLEEILGVKQTLIEYARQMKQATEFPATPNNLCSWCSFLDHCLEGKEQVKNSFQNFNSPSKFGEVSY